MSTFDIIPDAPGLLRTEAYNITLKFERTGPETGRVSWNIPAPAAGCVAGTQAYCGIVIAINTTPASIATSPTDGTVYASDNTADANLFAGDKLGGALVIGAFYHDRTTTFVDVVGLKDNTPYYVSGYPSDCEMRYHTEGVHAYSQGYTNRGTADTHGSQVVVLNPRADTMGAKPSDATGLDPSQTYQFKMQVGLIPTPNRPVDSTECVPQAPSYTIEVDGATSLTYQQLVDSINIELAKLTDGVVGPNPPNTNAYYWDSTVKKLYLWDGYKHNEVPVLVSATAPNLGVVGSYWHNTSTGELKRWDGAAWTAVTVLSSTSNPLLPNADSTYWFDGVSAYRWNGYTWCPMATRVTATDPSASANPPAGSYWWNPANSTLYRWDSTTASWGVIDKVDHTTDPNTAVDGEYWFNQVQSALLVRQAGAWTVTENTYVGDNAPFTPAPNKLWYAPKEERLFQRSAANDAWVEKTVTAYPTDPTTRSACGIWFDGTLVHIWDVLTSTWVTATSVYNQITDPVLGQTISTGAFWYNSTTHDSYVWSNGCFMSAMEVVMWATNPMTTIPNGVVWYNPTTKTYGEKNGSVWSSVTPVSTPYDPNIPTPGSFWFNSTSSTLHMWGGSWVPLPFSSSPLTPSRGLKWFNSTNNTLMEWNGSAWVPSTPVARVEMDCNGNLLFVDGRSGSTSFVKLTDGGLFSSLTPPATIHTPSPGTDGASSKPTYSQIGIGTDGNNAIRDALANDIRYELGYPVVDVELTHEQINFAISKAIATLRHRSGLAYRRGFFFMGIKANEQRYFLTNKIAGMEKIVDVIGVYRMTSSFVSSAHGAGVYGQIVLQHMYNMGAFDLLSYHIMAEYTKLMEILFAARVTFTWNEQTRELWMHQKFSMSEPMVCIEATVERTEQDIMSDRYAKTWIHRYAAAMCRTMLAEIRGKFSSLPGASGSITLNAAELRQAGQTEIEACIAEIESYVADRIEEYGLSGVAIG